MNLRFRMYLIHTIHMLQCLFGLFWPSSFVGGRSLRKKMNRPLLDLPASIQVKRQRPFGQRIAWVRARPLPNRGASVVYLTEPWLGTPNPPTPSLTFVLDASDEGILPFCWFCGRQSSSSSSEELGTNMSPTTLRVTDSPRKTPPLHVETIGGGNLKSREGGNRNPNFTKTTPLKHVKHECTLKLTCLCSKTFNAKMLMASVLLRSSVIIRFITHMSMWCHLWPKQKLKFPIFVIYSFSNCSHRQYH